MRIDDPEVSAGVARVAGQDPRVALDEAIALHRRGDLARARAIYERLLAREPRHFDALHLLGLIEFQTQHPRTAVRLIETALQIDPGSAIAHGNLGSALQELGEFDRALASFGRAVALDPGHADAFYNRGNLFGILKSWPDALANYDQAIALRPDFAEAWCNRGDVLQQMNRLEEALASFDRAVSIRDGFAQAHRNRALALHRLRRFEASLAAADRAIALQPTLAEAWHDRGVTLHELGRFDEALRSCSRAIELRPGFAETHSNRGVVQHELRQFAAARASFDRAIALDANFAQAHLNKSLTCLLTGDFAQGWAEHEWRVTEDRRFTAAPWRGEESPAGATVLLYAERGLGDTLQFCRYARLLAKQGARVVLEVQAPLRRLLSTLDGVDEVLARGDALPAFDRHCPLLSLPLAFKTTLASIPASIPYIHCDPVLRSEWGRRLGNTAKLRVGLVWSGGFRAAEPEQWSVNARRNIPLALLGALNVPGIEFVSLQKGPEATAELAAARAAGWEGPRIADYDALLADFADTAALVAHLDLVISVDTSTAHLAGAMGKPVWLLNRFDTCWRWLLDRSDSPWYPTLRLFRQDTPGDWRGVVARLSEELRALAAGHAIGAPRQHHDR
jgi:tetratricopeptide (TPR) repeat protein